MVTVLSDRGEIPLPAAAAEGDRLWLRAEDLASATGWSLRPEGLCKDALCVPIPPGRAKEFLREGRVDAAAVWRHLGKPVLRSEDGEAWLLGEAARERAGALQSLDAPDFALPDPRGRLHRLSDQRGRKVLLVSWASW